MGWRYWFAGIFVTLFLWTAADAAAEEPYIELYRYYEGEVTADLGYCLGTAAISVYVAAGRLLKGNIGDPVSDAVIQKYDELTESADFSGCGPLNRQPMILVQGAEAKGYPIITTREIDIFPDPNGPNLECWGAGASIGRCRAVIAPSNFAPALVYTNGRDNLVFVGAIQHQIYDPRTGRLYGEKPPK